MVRPSIGRRAIAPGAVLALAAPPAAQARDIHATDTGGNLLRFDSRFPGVVLNSTGAGTLVAGMPLGVDVGTLTSFDIAGVLNRGHMVTTPAGGTGPRLYGVDLATGRATEIGPIGTGSLVRAGTPRLTITGMARARRPWRRWPGSPRRCRSSPPRGARRRVSAPPTSRSRPTLTARSGASSGTPTATDATTTPSASRCAWR